MSEENKSCSGWTVSTLFTHFTALLEAQKEAARQTKENADKAMTKADAAFEKRLDSVNEFRSTLADQQRSLMPRAESEIRLAAHETRLQALENLDTRHEGRTDGIGLAWSIVLSAITVASVLYGLLKH